MRDEPLRVFFYSHDGHGLGHLRMMLMLAQVLAEREPTASILIATGAHAVDSSDLPDSIEIIKLPSVGASTSLAQARPVHGSGYAWRGVWAMREALIHEAVRAFDPHVLVGDNEPGGIMGELSRALLLMRSQTPRGRTLLGMNDFLGDPAGVRQRWAREDGFENLGQFDRVVVFGQADIFDPAKAYEFPEAVQAVTRFAGYLGRSAAATDVSAIRAGWNAAPGQTFVVVAGGGGEDGAPLLAAAIGAANLLPDARFLMIAGPLMPEIERERLKRELGENASVVDTLDDLDRTFTAADVVVIKGGYNSVVEAVTAGKRPIVVPRDDAWTEQRQRAERFDELGLAVFIPPAALTPARLAAAIASELAAQFSPPQLLQTNGIARAIDEMIALAPLVSERWPARPLPAATLTARRARGPEPGFASTERIHQGWDGTLFHVRAGDLIEDDIVRYGGFEITLQKILLAWLRPGDNVIDAGANIGAHACPMAIRVAPHGRVLAIEPVARIAARLAENCRINGLGNVEIIPQAVSNRRGRRTLTVPSQTAANQGVASFHAAIPSGELQVVETVTIDELVERRRLDALRLIKIDVEGDDLNVIEGALESMRRFRPIIAFEHHRGLWEKAGRALYEADNLLNRVLGYRLQPLPGDVTQIIAWPE